MILELVIVNFRYSEEFSVSPVIHYSEINSPVRKSQGHVVYFVLKNDLFSQVHGIYI